MSVIFAYQGSGNAASIFKKGLSTQEPHNYTASGLVLRQKQNWACVETKGVQGLFKYLADFSAMSTGGLAYLGWHFPEKLCRELKGNSDLAIVFLGAIENFAEINLMLVENGFSENQTAPELMADLIRYYQHKELKNLAEAVALASARAKGCISLLAMDRRFPQMVVGACRYLPLYAAAGGSGELFLASDSQVLSPWAKRYIALNSGEMIVVQGKDYKVTDFEGNVKEPVIRKFDWSEEEAARSGYAHFMQKEMYFQPINLIDILLGRLRGSRDGVDLPELENARQALTQARRLVLVACGTSYHACLIAQYMFESLSKVPVTVDLASEFRYRDPMVGPEDVVIAVSQSGETSETVAAVEVAKAKDAPIISICNTMDSTLSRASLGVLHTRSGREVGVASTKVFTAQVAAFYLLALYLGQIRGALKDSELQELIADLSSLPRLVCSALSQDTQARKVAEVFFEYQQMLFLGRGAGYPTALEGALKIKETSYMHCSGYPVGEVRHGPLAMIDAHMPILVLANKNNVTDKIISDIQLLRARGGKVVAVTEKDNRQAVELAHMTIFMPETPPLLAPITMAIALQLLAYHIACLRGNNVDEPRGLSKAVIEE